MSNSSKLKVNRTEKMKKKLNCVKEGTIRKTKKNASRHLINNVVYEIFTFKARFAILFKVLATHYIPHRGFGTEFQGFFFRMRERKSS